MFQTQEAMMAKNRRPSAPRDRKRSFFKVPKGPCDPKPPKVPPRPTPAKPGDSLWPDPLKLLKLGKRKP